MVSSTTMLMIIGCMSSGQSRQGSFNLQPLQAKARYQVRVLRPQLTSRILVSKTPQPPLASAIRSSGQAKSTAASRRHRDPITQRLRLSATRNQTRCGTSEKSEHIANAKVVRPKRRLARKTRLHRRGCPGPGRRNGAHWALYSLERQH